MGKPKSAKRREAALDVDPSLDVAAPPAESAWVLRGAKYRGSAFTSALVAAVGSATGTTALFVTGTAETADTIVESAIGRASGPAEAGNSVATCSASLLSAADVSGFCDFVRKLVR